MQGVAGSLVDQHIDSSHLASINDAVSSRENVVINQADPGSWHARQNCPRVTFLGPDSTRRNVDPTLPAIADKSLTRVTPLGSDPRSPSTCVQCFVSSTFKLSSGNNITYKLLHDYTRGTVNNITVYQPAIVIMQGLYGLNRRKISKNRYLSDWAN